MDSGVAGNSTPQTTSRYRRYITCGPPHTHLQSTRRFDFERDFLKLKRTDLEQNGTVSCCVGLLPAVVPKLQESTSGRSCSRTCCNFLEFVGGGRCQSGISAHAGAWVPGGLPGGGGGGVQSAGMFVHLSLTVTALVTTIPISRSSAASPIRVMTGTTLS